jgi:hypothetical protein
MLAGCAREDPPQRGAEFGGGDATPRATTDAIGLVAVDARTVTGIGDIVHQCTGTPLRGTNLVVTAGHCVLSVEGTNRVATPHQITVSTTTYRNPSVSGHVREIIVPLELVAGRLQRHRPEHDVALLVTDVDWPDHGVVSTAAWSARIGYAAYGLQTVGPDGRRLIPGDVPARPCATVDCTDEPELRRLTNFESISRTRVLTRCTGSGAPSGHPALEIACGLAAGGSGGPVVQRVDGTGVLVGVVSTMLDDGRRNRAAPAATVDAVRNGTIDTLRMPLTEP